MLQRAPASVIADGEMILNEVPDNAAHRTALHMCLPLRSSGEVRRQADRHPHHPAIVGGLMCIAHTRTAPDGRGQYNALLGGALFQK